MKKVFLCIFVVIFLIHQFPLSAKSQTGSHIWIIIDGSGAGVQVVSDTPGGTNITSNENISIMASGAINPPGSDCTGDKSYYSGELYGQSLLGGCGWGSYGTIIELFYAII